MRLNPYVMRIEEMHTRQQKRRHCESSEQYQSFGLTASEILLVQKKTGQSGQTDGNPYIFRQPSPNLPVRNVGLTVSPCLDTTLI